MTNSVVIGKGQAPGKIILFGEHAVVYGRPALAVPVFQVCAEAFVEPGKAGSGLVVDAHDLGIRVIVSQAAESEPLAAACRLACDRMELTQEPDWQVTVRSTIPIASGMGSGAAVSAAIVRAISVAAGGALTAEQVSELVFTVEQIHHGTPSGVDNTVISFGQPVYFIRGRSPVPFRVGRRLMLAIGDSGIASPTRAAVASLRAMWEKAPARYEALFDRAASVVEAARDALGTGRIEDLGSLMDQNHELLQEMDVSSPELDKLVEAARNAGAGGAKLSGGGRGGNMIALVTPETAAGVERALSAAGAAGVIVTEVV